MYTKIVNIKDIPDSGRCVFSVGDREILVAKVDDEFYAIDAICTHEEWSLESSDIYDGEIECELHGARFCIRTGAAKCFPATESLNTYKVVVSGGTIYIEVD